MSIDALLQAVKSHLQSEMSLQDLECDLTGEGAPVPMSGQQFIAIHDGGEEDASGDFDLDEYVSVLVTVTRRIGEAPLDQLAPELIHKVASGMGPDLRRIKGLIHKRYDLMNAANELIDDAYDKFKEPLRWIRTSPPQFKGPDWFNAGFDEHGAGTQQMCGVAKVMTFGRARRVQRMEGVG